MSPGPVTNTRTLDRALDDAIARLERSGDDRARELIAQAMDFRAEVASWELAPPTHSEQDAVIDAIMNLLSEAMLHTRGLSTPPPPPSDPGCRRGEPAPGVAEDAPRRHVLGRVRVGNKRK